MARTSDARWKKKGITLSEYVRELRSILFQRDPGRPDARIIKSRPNTSDPCLSLLVVLEFIIKVRKKDLFLVRRRLHRMSHHHICRKINYSAGRKQKDRLVMHVQCRRFSWCM